MDERSIDSQAIVIRDKISLNFLDVLPRGYMVPVGTLTSAEISLELWPS